MEAWIQAIVLGVVQGLTEFLPVSSSGHLVLAQAIFGESFEFRDMAVAFDLALHLGTLVPVLYFYRADLRRILTSALSRPQLDVMGWIRGDEARWLAFMVVLGTIPTALIGLFLKDGFEALFHSPRAVSVALFVTGLLLWSTRWSERAEGTRSLGVWIALAIGLAQGLAITPGISRSGSTIAVALLLGLERDQAARFSFLLSIPAITGAAVLVAKDGVGVPDGAWGALAAGCLSSMAVGYAALVLLVALVRRGGLHRFAWYLWPVAAVGFALTAR